MVTLCICLLSGFLAWKFGNYLQQLEENEQ